MRVSLMNTLVRKMKTKLFIFGLIGLAANILFYILFDFIQFYLWEVYLYGDGSYPGFIDLHGDLIVGLNTALIFIFVGFVVGTGLCVGCEKE